MNIEQLGPYRIEAELGHGGVATVYRAFHQPLRRYVALKVLDSTLSSNDEFLQRFEQEATLAAGLEHPNIIQVYDLGVADGYQYIAMRLIEGPTLEQLIRETGAMPAPRALSITAEISDALGYAHAQGVLHRDVKPSNVLMRANDRPVLTDFGIARAVEGLALTRAHTLVGTPRYMSPEQAKGQTLDPRSDLYSLGVVLYEMLAGKAPFEATSTHSLLYMHVHEPPRPLSQERPDLSPAVRELVDRCLAKTPDERYRSASDVSAICRALMVVPGLDLSDSTVVIPPPSSSQGSRSPTPVSWPSAPSARSASTGHNAPITPSPSRAPTPPPMGARQDAPWLAAPRAEAMAEPAMERPTAQSAAERSGGAGGGQRLPIPIPIAVGLAVALLGIVGWFVLGPGGSSGRANPTPTVVAAKPTTAPAAATAAPTVSAPVAAPTAAATAAAAAAGQPTQAPPPTQAAAANTPAAAASAAGDASARLNEAMAALGRRDWPMAVEQANAGLKADPKNPGLAKAAAQARLGYGQQLLSQGQEREAMIQFMAVREEPLRSAASAGELREAELSVPYLWGNLIWNTDLPLALVEYGKVFRRDPNFKDVRKRIFDANIAQAKQALGRNDREAAVRFLNAARDADPNGPELNDLFKSTTPTS